MNRHMDPLALDQVWDAQVLRAPYAERVDDPDEQLLLVLLDDIERPKPNVEFARTLEAVIAQEAARLPGPAGSSETSVRLPRISAPGRVPNLHAHNWPVALAVAALVLVLISGVMDLDLPGNVRERPPIPAALPWTDDGPPTSSGVVVRQLFSQSYSTSELVEHALDDWGWVALIRGSAAPHQESWWPYLPKRVGTYEGAGLNIVGVESGALSFELAKPVVVSRGGVPDPTRVAAGAVVTLDAGDALLYGQDALAAAWNPTNERTTYVAGGLYPVPASPLMFSSAVMDFKNFGTSIDSGFLDSIEAVDFTLSEVVIGPGEIFAYTVSDTSLLLASNTGNTLRKQRWSSGAQEGAARALIASSYTLHNDPEGYYTLTNTGAEPVEIFFFGLTVSPSNSDSPSID